MKAEVGLVLDQRYLQHAIDQRSPENPERLRLLAPRILERFGNACEICRSRSAEQADIEAVHSSFYLQQIRNHQLSADPFSYDRDTYLMHRSLATAELAAGGCLELADGIMAGQFSRGYAVVRPPGHHAEQGRGMGFCILNNVAIAAQYLIRKYSLSRILVVDFDAHHGNGTQEIFYGTDKVLFVSIHQKGIFPFSGEATELGEGEGRGFTINLPVHAQFGDQEYTYLIGRTLQMVVEQYLPQIIIVSAGYDGHRDDTISGLQLSTEWFGTVTAMFKQYARDACDGRLLMILEGGYNPVSLGASVIATLDKLVSTRIEKTGVLHSERAFQIIKDHPLRDFWTMGQ